MQNPSSGFKMSLQSDDFLGRTSLNALSLGGTLDEFMH